MQDNMIGAVIKNSVAWIMALIGSMTASQVAVYLAIAYSASTLYWGWRDHLRKRHEPTR